MMAPPKKPKSKVQMISQKNSQAGVHVPPGNETSRSTVFPKSSGGAAEKKKKVPFTKGKPTKARITLPKIAAYETQLEFQ
jgi:hypothetical protein